MKTGERKISYVKKMRYSSGIGRVLVCTVYAIFYDILKSEKRKRGYLNFHFVRGV